MHDWNDADLEAIRKLNREFSPWVDPLDSRERKALRRFCEITAQLEDSRIFKNLLHRDQVNSNVRWQNGIVVDASIQDFDEEELQAFLLTLRLLYQTRDHCSIQQIAEIVDLRVGDRHPLWSDFNAYRCGLNEFLNRGAAQSPHTNREIFETFLYGRYAHRDDAKEFVYLQWKNDRAGFVEKQTMFLVIVGTILFHVRHLSRSAEQLLTEDPGWKPLNKVQAASFASAI